MGWISDWCHVPASEGVSGIHSRTNHSSAISHLTVASANQRVVLRNMIEDVRVVTLILPWLVSANYISSSNERSVCAQVRPELTNERGEYSGFCDVKLKIFSN